MQRLTYFLFFISKGLMIINPGIFWDDWTIYNMDLKGIMSQFEGNGAVYFGYLHGFLQNLPFPVFVYRVLIVAFHFLNIFFLFKIFKKASFPERQQNIIFFSILIYAVLPINDAAITMITLPYPLCLFLFIAGTYLLLLVKEESGKVNRVGSLILYFLSFTTSSLIFFYIVPLIFVIYIEEVNFLALKSQKNWKPLLIRVLRKSLHYIDYLVLPVVFWVIRSLFFTPAKHYKAFNYNNIEVDSLFLIPIRFIKFIYLFFASSKFFFFDLISQKEFIFLFGIIILILFRKIKYDYLQFDLGKKVLFLAIFLIFVGVFPYLLVNKFPSFSAYKSRHMLLLGFGISALILYGISQVNSLFYKKMVVSIILSGAVVFNIYFQFSYFKGYMKQSVLTDIFSSIDPPKTSTTILFRDATSDFTSKGAPREFYELSGIYKRNRRENVLIIKEEDFAQYEKDGTFEILRPFFYQYNLSDYKLVEPDFYLDLKYSSQKRPVFPIFSYYKDYLLDQTELWNTYFVYDLSNYP